MLMSVLQVSISCRKLQQFSHHEMRFDPVDTTLLTMIFIIWREGERVMQMLWEMRRGKKRYSNIHYNDESEDSI